MSVVEFPLNAPRQLWQCECGCASFVLYLDGGSECSLCGAVLDVDGGGWLERVVDGSECSSDSPALRYDHNMNGCVDLARRQLVVRAGRPDASLIIVSDDAGSISTWASANSRDQYDWVLDQIDAAKALIAKMYEGFD